METLVVSLLIASLLIVLLVEQQVHTRFACHSGVSMIFF